MEVLAYIVFYACSTVTAVAGSCALWYLITEAIDGTTFSSERQARAILACLSLLVLVGGWIWSTLHLWGAP